MTISDTLKHSRLEGIDAEVLLAHALGKNRAWLVAHSDEEVDSSLQKTFQEFIARRKADEPVAYIVGSKEFYGREFVVTKDTLIPRPSTEILIDATLDFLLSPKNAEREADSEISIVSRVLQKKRPEVILDVGTGSGCIAITLACEKVSQEIIGIDTSEKALEVAKKNAERLSPNSNIEFVHADGIKFVAAFDQPFLLVSNPPYIPSTVTLEKNVADFEPHAALFAGRDGLDVIRPLVAAAQKNPQCVGLVLECRCDQVSAIIRA